MSKGTWLNINARGFGMRCDGMLNKVVMVRRPQNIFSNIIVFNIIALSYWGLFSQCSALRTACLQLSSYSCKLPYHVLSMSTSPYHGGYGSLVLKALDDQLEGYKLKFQVHQNATSGPLCKVKPPTFSFSVVCNVQ